MINAVHNVLKEAFQLPETDRDVCLVVHEPHRLSVPPNLLKPELFTVIRIDCFTGRSLDTKRYLYRLIIENYIIFNSFRSHQNYFKRKLFG